MLSRLLATAKPLQPLEPMPVESTRCSICVSQFWEQPQGQRRGARSTSSLGVDVGYIWSDQLGQKFVIVTENHQAGSWHRSEKDVVGKLIASPQMEYP